MGAEEVEAVGAGAAVALGAGAAAVAAERCKVEELKDDDFSNSSRCEKAEDGVVETRRACSWWPRRGAEKTISTGGVTTEKASEEATNSSREATAKRNMLVMLQRVYNVTRRSSMAVTLDLTKKCEGVTSEYWRRIDVS